MTDGNAMKNLVIEGQQVYPLLFSKEKPKDLIPIVKTDILQVSPSVAFVLDNVLSPSECKKVIAGGEKIGFDDLVHYNKKYRDNLRILVSSKTLAEVIFERIKPYLESSFQVGPNSSSTLSSKYLGAPKGTWNLYELNDLWRLCKYNPGGKFLPHYDGLYVKDKVTRSFLTFMIYLNDLSPEAGGHTRFLNEKSRDAPLAQVSPKAGSVLVFQHDIYHDGEILKSGLKYIIRSDVMYKLDDPNQNQQELESEREARRILSLAIEMEKVNPNESVILYKRAFKLHPPLEFES